MTTDPALRALLADGREALRTLSDFYYEDVLTAGRARAAIDRIEAALAAAEAAPLDVADRYGWGGAEEACNHGRSAHTDTGCRDCLCKQTYDGPLALFDGRTKPALAATSREGEGRVTDRRLDQRLKKNRSPDTEERTDG